MANTREIINTLWTSELEIQKVKGSMENWFSSSFLALAGCIFSEIMRKEGFSTLASVQSSKEMTLHE